MNILQKDEKIDISKNVKIGSCEVTNKYDKEKNTTYTNYVIFNFEDVDGNTNGGLKPVGNKPSGGDGFMNIPDGIDEELPFA